jgi:general secretion pathway protein B
MSFILEALRKAEHERDRRILPGIVDAPKAHTGRHTLRWIIGLGAALFIVNSVALVVLLMRDPRPASPSAAPVEAVTSAAPPMSAPQVSRSVASAAAPSTGAVRPLAEEVVAGARNTPYTDVPPTPSVRAVTPARATPPPAARPLAEPDPSTAGLPTRRQLPAALASALPPISVDLHVYSAVAAQRFMVISGQRAGEGATVAGGIVIEKITPDGAIAVFRGTRFLLTRE